MKVIFHVKAISATILIFVSLIIFSALEYGTGPMLLFSVLLGTCLFWITLSGWAEENKEKIKGRTFEYLFFLFLFIASYFVTVASSFAGAGSVDQRNFIRLFYASIFVISAVFSGFLHYVKKIYN